ncbi:hypothetical protein [Arthrobacter sp. Alg241-R88]|uniref:phage tail tube protein n=1 Tax=Arthrobacter sp. Alg241-R88 TaxID=2305984 RepID=UPI0013D7EAF7|nr:hypothetical protein [Arthrobacter sp. Alg241-R88]
MANDQTKVGVAVTGQIYRGALATAAPTSQASALNVGFVDLGYIGEGGVTSAIPASGDSTSLKAWQNGATIRILRSPSEDPATFSFVALETNKTVVESWAGATVTQTATEGTYTLNTTATRTHYSWVIDVVDGAELERVYIPDGVVFEVGDRVYANQEPIGYEMTISAEYNSGITGNAKVWSTRLKT